MPPNAPLRSVRIGEFGGMLRGTAQGREYPFSRLAQNLEPAHPLQPGFGPAPGVRPARGTTTKLTLTADPNRVAKAIYASDVPDRSSGFLISSTDENGAIEAMDIFDPAFDVSVPNPYDTISFDETTDPTVSPIPRYPSPDLSGNNYDLSPPFDRYYDGFLRTFLSGSDFPETQSFLLDSSLWDIAGDSASALSPIENAYQGGLAVRCSNSSAVAQETGEYRLIEEYSAAAKRITLASAFTQHPTAARRDEMHMFIVDPRRCWLFGATAIVGHDMQNNPGNSSHEWAFTGAITTPVSYEGGGVITCTLPASASHIDGFYVGADLAIVGLFGFGHCTAYDGSSKLLTALGTWTGSPSATQTIKMNFAGQGYVEIDGTPKAPCQTGTVPTDKYAFANYDVVLIQTSADLDLYGGSFSWGANYESDNRRLWIFNGSNGTWPGQIKTTETAVTDPTAYDVLLCPRFDT